MRIVKWSVRDVLPLTVAAVLVVACVSQGISKTPEPRVHPVVDSRGFLVGGTVDGRWESANQMARYVRGGERYKIYAGAQYTGTATGSKPDRNFMVRLRPDAGGRMAVVADWNPVPRKPTKHTKTHVDNERAIRSLLDQKGLTASPVQIADALQVDIDGDGRFEWLITAASMDPSTYAVGDYSLIALRKLKNGKWHTYLVAGDLHTRSDNKGVSRYYRVTEVYDLDNDNALEIVAECVVWGLESWSTEIYKLKADGARLVAAVRPNYDYKLK